MNDWMYGGEIRPKAKPLVNVAKQLYGEGYNPSDKTMDEVCFDIVKGKGLCSAAGTGTYGCCRTIVDTIC